MESKIKGKAFVYGDNIDTDRIIPGKFTKTLDLDQLADHVLEDLDPGFRTLAEVGDIVVGGENFGCGSSREQAPLALKAFGVSCVIARSFARIFYRNAINIGLPLLEISDHKINAGDEIVVELGQGIVTTPDDVHRVKPMPDVMISILDAGGLVPFLRDGGGDWLERR